MYNLQPLLSFTQPDLLKQLADVSTNLQLLYEDLSFTKKQELDLEQQAWVNSPETSIEGKKRSAKYASSPATKQIIELEGNIHILTEEKFFIIRLLDGLKVK